MRKVVGFRDIVPRTAFIPAIVHHTDSCILARLKHEVE